jgi:hypothetical protein
MSEGKIWKENESKFHRRRKGIFNQFNDALIGGSV